jgi:hypothetical protein
MAAPRKKCINCGERIGARSFLPACRDCARAGTVGAVVILVLQVLGHLLRLLG